MVIETVFGIDFTGFVFHLVLATATATKTPQSKTFGNQPLSTLPEESYFQDLGAVVDFTKMLPDLISHF